MDSQQALTMQYAPRPPFLLEKLVRLRYQGARVALAVLDSFNFVDVAAWQLGS